MALEHHVCKNKEQNYRIIAQNEPGALNEVQREKFAPKKLTQGYLSEINKFYPE